MCDAPKLSLSVCRGWIWHHRTTHNSCLLTTTIVDNDRAHHVTTVANGYHQPPLSPSPPTTIAGHVRRQQPTPTTRRQCHVTTPAAQCVPHDGACRRRRGKVPCRPDGDDACHRHRPLCEVSYYMTLPHLSFRPNAGATSPWAMWPPSHQHATIARTTANTTTMSTSTTTSMARPPTAHMRQRLLTTTERLPPTHIDHQQRQ